MTIAHHFFLMICPQADQLIFSGAEERFSHDEELQIDEIFFREVINHTNEYLMTEKTGIHP